MLYRAFALIAAVCLASCTDDDGSYAVAALSPALKTEGVDYARNEVWGSGPGGNETGFNVIRLADDAVSRVAKVGVTWLDAQSGGRLWPDWAETPVPQDEFWMGRPDSAAGSYPAPTVLAVLHRYGLPVEVPDDHRATLDAALNAPGSFYAFGPGGLVAVIVPATRRAYVFYAG
jgi:hypothetical protein